MITEYIRYRIPAERADAFEDAYRRAAEQLAAAPQCVDYDLARCEEEPESYILRIGWTSTDDHLRGFRGGEQFGPFLAAIREYVPLIEEMRHYRATGIAGAGGSVPSLYAWAGGLEALERLTEEFYREVIKDELLAPVFAGMSADHPKHVAAWLAEVFGGPTAYTRDHGGHAGMVRHHLGRAITEQQRRRWVTLLLEAADRVGLPDDPEFRASFVGYLEWGSRMAVVLSAPDARPDFKEPMPTWTWARPPWVPKP
ncbi:group II truncated hemoglobin [Microlunatus parietis]|uniref:Truncated hemoglobin YjbI/quinol monooxygenase YgiN n=1 Tax=Microlunatus parietis TaxID=682979 RepID=A0A7Y9I7Y4_9ACTN|nr:antibiotic biosynthesis monooxygenase [Microlunatus parietis]NYE71973.1 truncated hemoglobin YjbI/quinol monooxygenase YgiN [Microlunatus parietis]